MGKERIMLMRVVKAFLVAATVMAATLLPSTMAESQQGEGHWVSAWGAAPHAPLQFPGLPPVPTYEKQTLRMVVRPTIGGDRLRIRFSNAFGTSALKIGAAHAALVDRGSKIVAASDRELTFGGEKSIVIPPGAPALTDTISLDVPAFAEIAVSIFLPEKSAAATTHLLGQHETYVAGPGDLTGQVELQNTTANHTWLWLAGVEMWAPARTGTIVTLGDSITDGFGAKQGEYHDWPDQLAKRLAEVGSNNLAVVNEGIGGNRILHDGAGVSALTRFDRDVLSQPGVSKLILLEGINDVGWPHMKLPKDMDQSRVKLPDLSEEDVTANDLIMGMRQIIERAHEHGIRVFGATILPFEGANYFSDRGETTRQAVNQWIRTSGAFDGVIDFDAALRDPDHPSRFREAYQMGDHLHPSESGYKAMADDVDLSLFKPGGQ
jgi:lysophospholipase L1-like esterase